LSDLPLKDLAWSISEVHKKSDSVHYGYRLKVLKPEHWYSSNIYLDKQHQQYLEKIISWSVNQIEPPPTYKILDKIITPFLEIDSIYRVIIGIDMQGNKEKTYKVGVIIRHPTESEGHPGKIFYDDELPAEIIELLRSIDELIWIKIRSDLIRRFDLSDDELPIYLTNHVFIAYKSGNENSEKIAKRLGEFLRARKIPVWLFPWRVGWADSITKEEEQGIAGSFAAVICYTPDFLEGKTAREEYGALLAKKREDPDFKAGLFLIGCNHMLVPPFMKDYLWAEITDLEDQRFEEEAIKIYRGLLGLPLESPK